MFRWIDCVEDRSLYWLEFYKKSIPTTMNDVCERVYQIFKLY